MRTWKIPLAFSRRCSRKIQFDPRASFGAFPVQRICARISCRFELIHYNFNTFDFSMNKETIDQVSIFNRQQVKGFKYEEFKYSFEF